MKPSINFQLITATILAAAHLSSCSYNGEKKQTSELENTSYESMNTGVSAGTISGKSKERNHPFPVNQKKLIKKGNLSLQSKHIEKSKARLDEAIRSLQGYYDDEHFSKSDYEYRYSLEVRVPAKNFEQLLRIIHNGTDEIVSKDIRTEDVSGEYLDLQTRLKSKRAYLKRYEELLNKANSIEEMIRVEDQIRELIEEIESQEARLAFLEDQVGYSTLDIELYKTIPHSEAPGKPSFSENAGNAFSKGWIGIVTFVVWLLSIWPLLLILIPAGIFGYRKLKKAADKKN